MVLKNRIVAFVAGVLLGPALVWAGLETGTYISDLVSTNPLSSDLASTADDHIRLLKSTIKATFPNINNAVTVTDEQLNAVGASGVTGAANPTGTIGLAAVNGSATTYLRSDGAPVLSQAISPTWTGVHNFARTFTSVTDIAQRLSSASPGIALHQSSGAADNKYWLTYVFNEDLYSDLYSDDGGTAATWRKVSRTGTTVDRVAFPTAVASVGGVFSIGTVNTGAGVSSILQVRNTASGAALDVRHSSVGNVLANFHYEVTSGDPVFASFKTEAAGTERGSIDFDRAGVLIRYNTTSDARLKKNFKPAPSARKVIDCIEIESFDWRETGTHVDHGVVAQRLNKCAPYAVSKGKVWQVDKSTLIPAIIKYTQELEARLDRLEAQQHFQ